jgi:carboxypeptidase family protein
MKKSTTFHLFLCVTRSILLLSWLAALPVSGQVSTGQISGMVKDSAGGLLPGVTVLVTNEQTSLQRSATADNDGYYLVSNLRPGSYSVRIEQNGYKTFVRNKIQLTAGDRVDVSPLLQPGAIAETVTVLAGGGQVQTESGTVEQLIDGSQVRDIALNGRNLVQLLMTVPGVATTNDTFDRGGIATGGLADFTVNGMRTTSNAFTVDGGANQDI